MTPDKAARVAAFHESFDARVWAVAFCGIVPDADEELMTAWFANAIMRGYDEASRKYRPATPHLERIAAEAEALYEALRGIMDIATGARWGQGAAFDAARAVLRRIEE